MFSNKQTKESFWYEINEKLAFSFQLKSTYEVQKFKIIIFFHNNNVPIFYFPIWIFGPDFFASIFENLSFECFWGPAYWLYWKHHKTALDYFST